MPWVRQLDSGLWAATVYTGITPTDRITESHENKKIIEAWARKQEADRDRGTWLDPRLARTPVGDVWDLYGEGRRLEKASRKRDASHWRNWVGPQWAKAPVGGVRKPDVSKWIVGLERDQVGGWTVIASLALLRGLLEIAVDLGLIHANPASKVKTQPPPKHLDRNLTDEECDAILANAYSRFPGLACAGLMNEMMAYTGPRYEEIAPLRRRDDVIDMRNHMVNYREVLERDGTVRPYSKNADPEGRWVPIDDDLWPRFRAHVMTVLPGSLIFPAPDGGILHYGNWLKRVYGQGLIRRRPMTPDEIGEWKAQRIAEGKRPWKALWVVEEPVVVDPQPTPHDWRHLYGTRLSEAGIPMHERMALMGHIDQRSQGRYNNPRDPMFARAKTAIQSFRRARS